MVYAGIRAFVIFIKYLVENTPNFPTQTRFLAGPGDPDMVFEVDGRTVAVGNVKLFTDTNRRAVHLAPEHKWPVRYALVVHTKPFKVLVYKSTGEEYVAERSV